MAALRRLAVNLIFVAWLERVLAEQQWLLLINTDRNTPLFRWTEASPNSQVMLVLPRKLPLMKSWDRAWSSHENAALSDVICYIKLEHGGKRISFASELSLRPDAHVMPESGVSIRHEKGLIKIVLLEVVNVIPSFSRSLFGAIARTSHEGQNAGIATVTVQWFL